MDQKTVIEYGLWLFACERFCRLLEVTYNGFEHGVCVLYYNRSIETLPLNGSYPEWVSSRFRNPN